MMGSMKDAFAAAEILQAASPSSRAQIASFAILKQYRKGEHLFWDKDEVHFLYLLTEGRVSLYKMNSQGEKKVIFVYGPGKMLNEVMLQELPASISCAALEDSQALLFPVEAFWNVMEQDGKLTRAVVESMALKIRRLYRQLKNTTNDLNGDKKLAAKLFKLGRDYGIQEAQGVRIRMPLTITYLSEMLGSKRETVSRQMKKLSEIGLVCYRKDTVIVKDMEDLSKFFKNEHETKAL